MRKSVRKKLITWIIIAVAVLGLAILIYFTGWWKAIMPVPAPIVSVNSAYTVQVAENPTLGKYLADSAGQTLYHFTKDVVGTSNCKDACAALWSPFYSEQISVPAGVNFSDFAFIVRGDGTKQTTYKGKPLYYYSKDANPGDVTGNGFNGFWFVVTP